ncbi:MAG: pseudaminic acid synthase [Candidatus Omnitrophota bacterium]|jgi:N-acetylneuraminate synthase
MKSFKIGDRTISGKHPAYIVAEISANHGQSFPRAVAMVRKAKECGADAVKFQVYTPDTMTIDVHNKYFRIRHPEWGGQTLYQLYQKAYTPWPWLKKLKAVADDIGLGFFATAFDASSVDFLETLNVSVHKIASFELVDTPLITYAARTGKPLIMSTGMAEKEEIQDAVTAARRGGARDILLFKCVSNYPAQPGEMNLRVIPDMARRFNVPVGLSDHTLTLGASVAAVCLGAVMIEQHFTLTRRKKTPDSFFSTEPREFKMLVDNIRVTEQALGTATYVKTEGEKKSRVFRRSLFAVADIKRGERFTADNIRSIRPAYGLPPKELRKVMGRHAAKDIRRGTPVSKELIAAS